MSKVFLVDGSGYIFRAFYAVAPLSTKDGFPTNALFGFVKMLTKLINDSATEHLVMVFDTGAKTFRHEMYLEYKANRAECPADLVKQMPFFRDIARAFGLKVIEQDRYEADDIIGTLATRLSKAEIETVVVSGDKDLMQLVCDKVQIFDAMKDTWIGAKEVKEKFGVEPNRVVEVLALMGDSSDNIPGVQGVGPKTATQLVELFGDVESVIKEVGKIRETKAIRGREKVAASIEENLEILRLSRKLVEIDCDMPLNFELNGSQRTLSQVPDSELYDLLVRRDLDNDALQSLAEKFEFASLLKGIKVGSISKKESTPKQEYKTITNQNFQEFLSNLKQQKYFAFDIETTSLDTFAAKIVGMSFCWSAQEAFYVAIGHKDPGGLQQVDETEILKELTPIMADSRIKKSGQNLKYDIQVLMQYGIEVEGVYFDTMIASYLLSPDRRSNSLAALAKDHLNINVIEYKEVVGELADFSYITIEAATRYSAEDAHMAWLLIDKLGPILKQRNLQKLFDEIEMPLVSVLARLERQGIKLDIDLLSALSEEIDSRLLKLKTDLYAMAGEEFNINSTQQLSKIMFDKMGLSPKGIKKTKTGKVSTNQAMLEILATQHEFPNTVLKYRTLFKLKSTYVDVLPTLVSPYTERLHSRFNQTVTGTGRLSSSDPNLQNIPIRTEEGSRIRSAFIAEKGNVLLVADYSQIELRLLAHLSGDRNLIQTFIENVDIHTRTAREILGLGPLFDISTDQRRIGKTINFGIIYGMGPYRLSRELGIPMSVAKAYIENYFGNYPKVREYFDSVERDAREKGFVTTLFGRQRNIADIDATGRDKEFVIRAAINAPLQGTAADIIKLAMIKIDNYIKAKPIKMILQVHDELVFECQEDFKSEAIELIQKEMEGVVSLAVPLKVGIGVGLNWNDAH